MSSYSNTIAWCSWCGRCARHRLVRAKRFGRAIHQCEHCDLPTVPCRFCDNMARAAVPPDRGVHEAQGRLSRLVSGYWNHALCAEHDGSIPDFERAGDRISELGEFRALMRPRRRNLYAAGKTGGAVLGGMAVVGAGAWLAAPGIAAAAGAKGALGAAATGTAVKSVSGTALASASLAKAGAGSLAVVTAVSAGLGGHAGYSLAHAYLRDVPDYDFRNKRPGQSASTHQLVVVNGFLTEDDEDAGDWYLGLEDCCPDSGLYYLNWEAKTLRKLGGMLGGTAGLAMLKRGAGLVSKPFSQKLVRGNRLIMAAGLAANPWHSAMVNAEKAGALLAEAISRTEGKSYTLMGHSLGARVVMFALMALASKDEGPYVRDAVLMGAALGRDCRHDWERAASAVSGRLYNCYSHHDNVLRFLYQGANVGLSRPAGLVGVRHAVDGVENVNFSDRVSGHNAWKDALPEVVERLELTGG